jgi:hypothetical protein
VVVLFVFSPCSPDQHDVKHCWLGRRRRRRRRQEPKKLAAARAERGLEM